MRLERFVDFQGMVGYDLRLPWFVARFWRRPSWRPFLSRRYTIVSAGVFGFCFCLMRYAPALPREE